MKPYDGVEDRTFYENLRIGQITQIDYNVPQSGGQVRRSTYCTAQIQWADTRLGTVDQISLSFAAAGRGWGIISYPKPGDIVIVGFRVGGYGVVLGYLMGNPFLERGTPDPINGEPGPYVSLEGQIPYRPTRYLSGGELFLRSFEGAELYMDRFANMRFTIREPRTDDSDSIDPSALQSNINYSKEQPKIWDITFGKAMQDDKYLYGPGNTEGQPEFNPKVSFNGTDVNLDLSHNSGFNLQVDKEGSLGIITPKDVLFSTAGESVNQSGGGYSIIVNGTNTSVTILMRPDGSIVMTDGNGSTITMDGTGSIGLISANGTGINIEDDNVQIATSQGTGVVVDELSKTVTVNSQSVVINGGSIALGSNASHPVVLADLLALFFNTHQHISGAPGNPTSPPVVPLVPQTISSITTIAE